MILPLTPAEISVQERANALTTRNAALHERARSLYSLNYNEREDLNAALQKEREALATENAALQADPAHTTLQLKLALDQAVQEKIPGGSLPAILTLVEETIGLLDTPTSTQMGGIVRNLTVRLFDAFADAEVAAARARGIKARYDALLATGLPESFVQNLMVAEASRPWPSGVSVKAR